MLLKKKLHSYFLLTSIFYIFCYIVITPPFYVADEQAHFQKVEGPNECQVGIEGNKEVD